MAGRPGAAATGTEDLLIQEIVSTVVDAVSRPIADAVKALTPAPRPPSDPWYSDDDRKRATSAREGWIPRRPGRLLSRRARQERLLDQAERHGWRWRGVDHG